MKIYFHRKNVWARQELTTVLSGEQKLLSKKYCNAIKSEALNYFDCCAVLCLVSQSCLTLRDPMDCSPPGSSVHGILQGRILEWVAIPFSRGSSQLRDQTQVSYIAGRFFII